jgi:antitoxin HigA-1
MIPKKRRATHPGVILMKEFIEPLGLTQQEVADHLGVPIQRINEIIKGKRGISTETAWFFSEAFETTPEFWLNLQLMYDLTSNPPTRKVTSMLKK